MPHLSGVFAGKEDLEKLTCVVCVGCCNTSVHVCAKETLWNDKELYECVSRGCVQAGDEKTIRAFMPKARRWTGLFVVQLCKLQGKLTPAQSKV